MLILLLLASSLSTASNRGSVGVNCNAQDADLEEFFVEGNIPMQCILGENVTAHIFARITSTAAVRYDFGVIIALDDGIGESGMCANFNVY